MWMVDDWRRIPGDETLYKPAQCLNIQNGRPWDFKHSDWLLVLWAFPASDCAASWCVIIFALEDTRYFQVQRSVGDELLLNWRRRAAKKVLVDTRYLFGHLYINSPCCFIPLAARNEMWLLLILNTERSFPNTRRPVSAQHVSRRRLQHVSWVLEPTQHYSIASALPGRESGRSLNIHCVSAEAMSRKTRCENTHWNYFRKALRAHPNL